MAGKVPTWKPAKGTMSGRDYGKAVSSAAKVMGMQAHRPMTDDAVAGRIKPVTPKTPSVKRKRGA